MVRRRMKASTWRWCSLIASFAFLTTVNGGEGEDVGESSPYKDTLFDTSTAPQRQTCGHAKADRWLLLVSTLDGKMSALNMHKQGAIEWSIDTGPGDLLSSSISKLEVKRNGVITRLIPSLDGGLYQFDGETVEPVPFTADTLLSHSFRFNDDSTIVGGKESQTYGIDAKSGQVRYSCTSDGCQQTGERSTEGEEDEVLMVTRHSKTVRAVEMRTGAEKWNFSVGEHELSYIAQSKHNAKQTGDVQGALTDQSTQQSAQDVIIDMEVEEDNEEDDEEATVCSSEDTDIAEEENETGGFFEFPWWHEEADRAEIKVIVPSGMVIAVSRKDPGHVLWKYKFSTPIANAWTLEGGVLEAMDLFDAKNIPALSFEQKTIDPNDEMLPPSPAMYIGLHEKQIYVQPSVQILHAYEDTLAAAMSQGQLSHLTMPKVNWMPYLASAPSRTPAAIERHNPMQITWQQAIDEHTLDPETGLALWHAEYPYDPGYYLYYERMPIPLPDKPVQEEEPSIYNTDINVNLWNWWKEVVGITIVTSILVHLVVVRLCYREAKPTLPLLCGAATEGAEDTNSAKEIIYGEEVKVEEIVSVASNKPVEYESRYETDFDEIAVLGKGGFGVVYHARNKLDDCDYAVKRITLKNSDRAREKVGREVKALAKLDHAGIVRYYNAWFESPPPGWQESRDQSHDAANSMSSPGLVTFSEYSHEQGIEHDVNSKTRPSRFNPLKPFDEQLLNMSDKGDSRENREDTSSEWSHSYMFGGGGDASLIQERQKLHKGSSYGFISRTDKDLDSLSWDESGSFSVNQDPTQFIPTSSQGDSFGIDFKEDSESLSRQHSSKSIPFGTYFAGCDNSCDIVFEDSGCGEKSSNNNNDHDEDIVLNISHSSKGSSSATTSQANSSLSLSTVQSCSPTGPDTLDIIPEGSERPLSAAGQSHTAPIPKLYLYIQMQLCRKESLKDWLAGNTLNRSRPQSLDIFDQIVSAVDYVHECGLMHRDLKPSNIFFSLDGTVKVGDFGLATEECRTGLVTPMGGRTGHTHTNQVGTKLYMSPEQNAGKQYTNKVDIYALGLILFELLYPFATMMERGQVMQRVKRLDFPHRFKKELIEECSLVHSLLCHIPEERPTSTEILDQPMLVDVRSSRVEKRARTNSRNRTVSTKSSDSASNSTQDA